MPTSRQICRVLAGALLLAPAAVLAVLICRYSVNVPYWDAWEADMAGLFEKYATGSLRLGDLFAQHNEARPAFQRVASLALGNLTHGDVRFEGALTYLIACLIAMMIYRLEERGYERTPVLRLVSILLSSFLIFSPLHYDYWLWGFCLGNIVPLACITAGLLAAHWQSSGWVRLSACAALSFVSTYSVANGALCWLILFPALFWCGNPRPFSRRKLAMALWWSAFAFCESLYFLGYQHSSDQGTSFTLGWMLVEDPFRAADYLFAFLGTPLAMGMRSPMDASVALGALFALLYVCACVAVFWLKRSRRLTTTALPWLALGAFSILSGLLAAGGRGGQYGVEQAVSSRYGMFALGLPLALIHLAPLLALEYLGMKSPSPTTRRLVYAGLGSLALGVSYLHFRAFPAGIWAMQVTRSDRLLAKTCLAFFHVLPTQPETVAVLYPYYERLRPMVASLERLGLLQPPPFTDYPSHLFARTAQSGNEPFGRFESCAQTGTNQILLAGWALAHSRTREADAILLTYEKEGGEPRLFALVTQRVLRPDLASRYGKGPYFYSGWKKTCSLSDLPRGRLVLRAWSYDIERQKARPLQGAEPVENK